MEKSKIFPLRGLRNWQRRFFRPGFFWPGEPELLAAAPEESAFVIRALGLKKGDALLDLCCGTGRHSTVLARRGFEVVGLDATAAYLQEARRRAGGRGNLRFVRGDMRRIPYRSAFDAAINLWTSFGYFLDPEDDLEVLRGVVRALKPGGRFLIDIINADWLRRHGNPKMWYPCSDGGYILEDVTMREGRDPAHMNLRTVLRPGKRPIRETFFVRSYNYDRLAKSLRRAGLKPVGRWGGLDGSSYRPDCKRLVIVARKPG